MDSTRRIDRLTVIGMAVFVYIVSTLLHEGLGHGGACLAVGGVPKVWSAYYFDCDAKGMAMRIVAAAGNTVNLLCAIVFGLWLKHDLDRGPDQPRGAFSLFLWFMFALNGFDWAGYFLFSGATGIGDWGTGAGGVLYALPTAMPAQIAMFTAGALAYFLFVRAAGRTLAVLIGGEDNMPTGRKLAFTAYFSGGVVAVLIGLLNPQGIFVVLASAAASSFGGTSGFLWQHSFIRPRPPSAFALKRNWLWIATGLATIVAYAVILGGK